MKKTFNYLPIALAASMLFVREGEQVPPIVPPIVPPAGTGKSMAEQIAEAVALEVKGLRAKNDELLGKNKDYQTRLASFGNIDPEKAKALMETMDHDEDARLFADGKKNVVIDKYTERMRTAHAAELETERQRTAAETDRGNTYRSAVLDNQIRSVTTDLHKGAVDDALLHARQIFTLDAKGNAVKLDANGNPELGKDGKTPFSPGEWMEMQRELKPHWFPASTSGSGSNGAQGSGSSTGKTIQRSAFNVLTVSQQGNLVRSGTRIVD